MDVREKLVELLAVHCDMKDKRCIGCEKGLQEAIECKNGRFGKIADHLISHGVTVQEWISVKDRLPEEHDCFFTSYYGTNKWKDGMFRQISDTVLAVVEYEDGKIRVKATITKDGKWDFSKFYRASKVTHWMPLPQPPKGE